MYSFQQGIQTMIRDFIRDLMIFRQKKAEVLQDKKIPESK